MKYRLYLLVRRFLCWRGIHDYEFEKPLDDRTAVLTCFYCEREREKTSTNVSSGSVTPNIEQKV